MDKKEGMPMWVFLGLVNIETKKGATILVLAAVLCGLVFVPLPLILDNWSWIDVRDWSGMMFIVALWYWLSMRWVDKNTGWN